MSFRTRAPMRMAGAVVSSGHIDTGEVRMTRGGERVISVSGTFSGNPGGGIALASGVAGRVNSVILHEQPGTIWSQSGVAVRLFDAGAIPLSGGPFPISGEKLIWVGNGPVGHSGQIAGAGKFEVDMPFQSGLWARAASGAPGFSLSWTPEASRSGSVIDEAT